MEVSSMPWPLHLQGNLSQFPLYMKLVGHRVSLNAMQKRTIFSPLPEIKHGFFSCLVTVSTQLSQLLVGYSVLNYMEFWC
jgi:hypothetical protein